MHVRSTPHLVAALCLLALAARPPAAVAQEQPPVSEVELRRAAGPPPAAVTFGDGRHGARLAGRGEPVEPALSLEIAVSDAPPDGALVFNPELRATLSMILAGRGTPALVYAPELRLVALRALATEVAGQRPARARAARVAPQRAAADTTGPARARRARVDLGGDRLGTPTDPVEGLDLPPEMPAIHWPEFVAGSCTGVRPGTSLWEAKRAWALAHHDVWRAYQMMEFIGESPSQFQDDYWEDGHAPLDSARNWSPDHWFGGYAPHRQAAIRRVVKELWGRFRTGDFEGVQIHIKCPTTRNETENPGNICLTHEPPAHHVVKGWINLCESSFADGVGPNARAFTLVHEMLHHARVHWKDGDLWKSAFLGDLKFHGHGASCLSGVKWEKMYGYDNVRHLATAEGCWHRNLAMRNNDTYAYFINRLGGAVRSGKLKKYPTEGTPWQTPGGSGNQCSANPVPPPGEDIQDPDACFKPGGGQPMICPDQGTGVASGAVLNDACLSTPMGPGG